MIQPALDAAACRGRQQRRRVNVGRAEMRLVVTPFDYPQHGHPMLEASGSVREFIGTVVDITERRRAEEAHARQIRIAALRNEINAVFTRSETLRSMLQGVSPDIRPAAQAPDARLSAGVWHGLFPE
jgi:hypothetical protein